MDPALQELVEMGVEDDEVSVILRLEDESSIPSDVRVISRFGKIVTVRLRRGSIGRVYERDEVASMKAPRDVVSSMFYDEDVTETLGEIEAQAAAGPSLTQPVAEDGSGVVVGICDWGFDFTHDNFRNADGTTRFLALWDQSAKDGEAPMPYGYGRVYTREEINQALAADDPTAALGYHPCKGDPSNNGSHGTHVLDILAGNRREPGSRVGLASGADLVCVHLASERLRILENFGDSVRLLEGIDFLRRQAGEKPLVVHLSAGKTGGPHDGTVLFEQAMDAMVTEQPGITLVQSTGNYANSRLHTHARLRQNQQHTLHWLISTRDRTPNELEVWYSGHDCLDVTLAAPNGMRHFVPLGDRAKLVSNGTHWGTVYHRRSEPNSGMHHIDIFLRTSAPPGHYRIILGGRDVVDGRYHAWIERDAVGPHQSRFARKQATSRCTTNTICNSFRGIAVGAYDATSVEKPPTPFSSRGPTVDGRQKPELCAPGNRILAARSLPKNGWRDERRLTVKSGTSMAAPWVSGTVALMTQAAGRPLSIREVRKILIATVDPPQERPGYDPTRLGYGYLNIVAAVDAARHLGRISLRESESALSDSTRAVEVVSWQPRWIVDMQPFEHLGLDMSNTAYSQDAESAALTASTEDIVLRGV